MKAYNPYKIKFSKLLNEMEDYKSTEKNIKNVNSDTHAAAVIDANKAYREKKQEAFRKDSEAHDIKETAKKQGIKVTEENFNFFEDTDDFEDLDFFKNDNGDYNYSKPDNEDVLKEFAYKVDELVKPIFIVASFTNSIPGKIITTYTNSRFSHIGISLDSSLSKIYSYTNNDANLNYNIKSGGGLSSESIDRYINQDKNSIIAVCCMFLKVSDYNLISNKIDYLINNSIKTTYSLISYLNFIFNKVIIQKDTEFEEVCSTFVANLILNVLGINISIKDTNLSTPDDLIYRRINKSYKIFDGEARLYNSRYINQQVGILKRSKTTELLKM